MLLVLSLGLHWALLQTAAWTGMLVTYSRQTGFVDAVTRTFDGKHPCPMCKAIERGRAQEREEQQKSGAKPGTKLELGLVWQSGPFLFVPPVAEEFAEPHPGSPRADPPPKPRPRAT